MANKLTVCGDLSASGTIYGTLDQVASGSVNTGTGTANTWAGCCAAKGIQAGATYNTAFGYHALSGLTTGDYNTAFGALSLCCNTTGNRNTGSGYRTLYNNTTGQYNSALGYSVLHNNTTGSANTAIGYSAMYYNTTSS